MVTRGTKHLILPMLALAIGVTACGDDDDGTSPPETGSITVETTTNGTPQVDSYGISIDGSAAGTIGPNTSRTFSDQSTGSHSVELTDVNPCQVVGSNPQNVTVVGGQTITITFSVQCAP